MVFFIILIASFLLQLIAPWWVIVIISFVVCGLLGKTAKIALWSPFLAILLLWIGMALFKSIPNEHVLATRIGEMLMVKSWILILVLSGIMGGFVAAISGFCGYHFRKAVLYRKCNS
jgi:nitrate/nitrite transporter NarK